jgi:hypothetical protein
LRWVLMASPRTRRYLGAQTGATACYRYSKANPQLEPIDLLLLLQFPGRSFKNWHVKSWSSYANRKHETGRRGGAFVASLPPA